MLDRIQARKRAYLLSPNCLNCLKLFSNKTKVTLYKIIIRLVVTYEFESGL